MKLNLTTYTSGVDRVIRGEARLLITERKDERIPEGLKKIGIDGIVISDSYLSELKDIGDFSMLECEVIIIPKKLHMKAKDGYENASICQHLTGGYENKEHWKKHINL